MGWLDDLYNRMQKADQLIIDIFAWCSECEECSDTMPTELYERLEDHACLHWVYKEKKEE
jgi:hypothetical protein